MREQCKKASFSSEAVADYYIEKLKRTSVRSKKPVRAYLCPKCFTWHLTSIKNTKDFDVSRPEKEIERLKKKCGNYQQEIKKLNNFIIKLKNNETRRKIVGAEM